MSYKDLLYEDLLYESYQIDISLDDLLMILHDNFYCESWAREQLGLCYQTFKKLIDEFEIKSRELKREQYVLFGRNGKNYCILTSERETFSTEQKTYSAYDLLANWSSSKTGERVDTRQAINSFVNSRSIREKENDNHNPIHFSKAAYERLLTENRHKYERHIMLRSMNSNPQG